jgi:hypothetical protein
VDLAQPPLSLSSHPTAVRDLARGQRVDAFRIRLDHVEKKAPVDGSE